MFIKLQFRGCSHRTFSRPVLCGMLCCLMGTGAFAEMRVWHRTDGSRFEAEFLRELPGKVFFKGVDKQNFTVELTNLVANDVKFIRTTVLPELEIIFSKSITEPEKSEHSWQTAHDMEVTGTVLVKRKSKFPFEGELPGEVYLIAKEVATDDFRLFEKKKFVVKFPEGSREFKFTVKAVVSNYEEYTTEMRGAFYEGYVVILFDLQGNLLALDTDLSWMNESLVGALRKFPVPLFFDKMCKKRSVPRPISGYQGGDFNY